jgi:hypothetical protein
VGVVDLGEDREREMGTESSSTEPFACLVAKVHNFFGERWGAFAGWAWPSASALARAFLLHSSNSKYFGNRAICHGLAAG